MGSRRHDDEILVMRFAPPCRQAESALVFNVNFATESGRPANQVANRHNPNLTIRCGHQGEPTTTWGELNRVARGWQWEISDKRSSTSWLEMHPQLHAGGNEDNCAVAVPMGSDSGRSDTIRAEERLEFEQGHARFTRHRRRPSIDAAMFTGVCLGNHHCDERSCVRGFEGRLSLPRLEGASSRRQTVGRQIKRRLPPTRPAWRSCRPGPVSPSWPGRTAAAVHSTRNQPIRPFESIFCFWYRVPPS